MKLAFVHIPKTAGGTIKDWFSDNSPNTLIKGGHIFLDQYNDYDYSFTITRNTYKRLVSLYVFTRNSFDHKIRKRIAKGNIDQIPEIEKSREYANKGILPWLEYVKSKDYKSIRPLAVWTKDVDFILSQENLNEDFKQIQNLCNCNSPIFNHSPRAHISSYNYKEFATPQYIKWIEDNYAAELEKYNYKPF